MIKPIVHSDPDGQMSRTAITAILRLARKW
jgi:hypothetical protein